MNAKHTEFLAYDRIADLRREATAARQAVASRPQRAPRAARIGEFSIRTLGRIRLVLHHAGA